MINGISTGSKGKVTCLFGSPTTWVQSTITLNEPYTNYDLIYFIYSHSGENMSAATASSYVDCKSYPSLMLSELQQTGGAIALFGYSTRFVKYAITNETTLTFIRNGDSGSTGIIEIWGVKL